MIAIPTRYRTPLLHEGTLTALRLLLLIPIVHAEADLGSFSGAVKQDYLHQHGVTKWEQHQTAIHKVWTAIDQLVHQVIDAMALPYSRVRLYQDGLADSGREAEIVKAVADQGSRNYQLLLALMHKGAQVMGTESPGLLAKEYELLRLTRLDQTAAEKPDATRKDGRQLLAERDGYIAQRIDATLGADEIGLLFLGLAHAIEPFLARDIQVKNLLPSLSAIAPPPTNENKY